MAIARYWRLTITKVVVISNNAHVGELQLRADSDGSGPNLSVTGNGTASSSSFSTYAPALAFDNNAVTFWQCGAANSGWLQWDFGTITNINHVRLINPTDYASNNVQQGNLSYSDDGVTWTNFTTLFSMATALNAINNFTEEPKGVMSAVMPMVLAKAYAGASLSATMPMATVKAYTGGVASIAMPAMRFSGAFTQPGESGLSTTMPMFSLSAFTGGSLSARMPKLALDIRGTFGNVGNMSATMPSIRINAKGTIGTVGSLSATMPIAKLVGYAGAVLSVTLTDGYKMNATGVIGSVGKASITLPMFTLEATGTKVNSGQLSVTMPMLESVKGANAWIAMPMFTLTAIGSATITATYEAYALNLNHTGEKVVDQMTHYTNFPFTHVVRYKNSYYGVAAGGLYLLEGTTDVGAPIAWQFKTGITDFGTANLKTVTYAYFGGRFGPGATVSIYPGESGGNSYSYTTPRGQAAQNYRQQFGRGLKARYFAVGASGTDALELDSLELITDTLSRRI